MTSQIYQADDDQLVQEHDQAVPEDNLMEADADLAESEADPMAPDADQTGSEDPASHPADAVTPADLESAASIASVSPGFTPDADGDGDAEDSSPGSPSLVSAAFTVPETVTDSHPAGYPAGTEAPWNEIQAMFVDDPHAAIERAAGMVDDRVEGLIQSLRTRQHSMQSAWQAENAGTEELRVALQHYRTFWNSLDDLPAQT